MRRKTSLLLALLLSATFVRAQCGVDKPFKVYVRKSSHRDNVEVPSSGCRTREGPCKASGTVFIVSSKKVKYTIFLVDGITSNLHVGESYTVTLSCGANPMMILNGPEGHATGSLYVLGQEALATDGLYENDQ